MWRMDFVNYIQKLHIWNYIDLYWCAWSSYLSWVGWLIDVKFVIHFRNIVSFLSDVPFSMFLLPCCIECRRGLAMRILSVCLSVCQTSNPWQNGRKSCPDFYTIRRSFSLVFWEEEWLVGGGPFYLKYWVNRPPFEQNRRFSANNRS